jgi:hypothetical protein
MAKQLGFSEFLSATDRFTRCLENGGNGRTLIVRVYTSSVQTDWMSGFQKRDFSPAAA